jgi:hypothetical protein
MDSCNAEFFTWDKNEIKFEVTKTVKGYKGKDILDEYLANYDLVFENTNSNIDKNINNINQKITLKSQYSGEIIKGIDKNIDLKIFIPKKIKSIFLDIKIGEVNFNDPIIGDVSANLNMANIMFDNFEGKINVQGDMGNIEIKKGMIKANSSIVKNMGDIRIKADFENGGIYMFYTNVGLIELSLPKSLRAQFSTSLEVENEFANIDSSTNISANSNMGKVTIKKY